MWFQLVVEQMQAELTAADPVPGGSVVGSEEEVVGEACEDVRRLSNLGRRISESIRLKGIEHSHLHRAGGHSHEDCERAVNEVDLLRQQEMTLYLMASTALYAQFGRVIESLEIRNGWKVIVQKQKLTLREEVLMLVGRLLGVKIRISTTE